MTVIKRKLQQIRKRAIKSGMRLLTQDEILEKVMNTRSGDNIAQPFRVERDMHGYAVGIQHKNQRLLSLVKGGALNEQNADKLVSVLNAAVAMAKIHLNIMESGELVKALQDLTRRMTNEEKV